MTISVRLDRKTEEILDRLARDRRRSKSDVIRDLLRSQDGTRSRRIGTREPTAYDLLKPFIGRFRSDGTLLAGDQKARWKAHLIKKHFPDRAR